MSEFPIQLGTVETKRFVDYGDLEDVVYAFYPVDRQNTSIIADKEWNNDSKYTVNIEDGDDDEEQITAWFNGERYDRYSRQPWVNAMLNELAGMGIIEPGDYICEVSW